MKTNAARILDSLGIAYEVREYEVDEEDLSAESVRRPSPHALHSRTATGMIGLPSR